MICYKSTSKNIFVRLIIFKSRRINDCAARFRTEIVDKKLKNCNIRNEVTFWTKKYTYQEITPYEDFVSSRAVLVVFL